MRPPTSAPPQAWSLGAMLTHSSIGAEADKARHVDSCGPTYDLHVVHSELLALVLTQAALSRDWQRAAVLAAAGLVVRPLATDAQHRTDADILLPQLVRCQRVCSLPLTRRTGDGGAPARAACRRRPTRRRRHSREAAATLRPGSHATAGVLAAHSHSLRRLGAAPGGCRARSTRQQRRRGCGARDRAAVSKRPRPRYTQRARRG